MHEPKDITLASDGYVYVADGAGSGDWEFPQLEGQAAAAEGSVPIKTSSSVAWQVHPALSPRYCEVDTTEATMSLTGSTEIAVTGGYLDHYTTGKFSLATGSALTVVDAGVYMMHLQINLKPQTTLGASNENLEARLYVNGVVTEPASIIPIVISRNSTSDDVFTSGGTRILPLEAGDVLTMTIKNLASTRSYKVQAAFNLVRIAS